MASGHSSFYLKGEGEAAGYKAASILVLICMCLDSQQQIPVKAVGIPPVWQGCTFCHCQYHRFGLKLADARKPMCIHFNLNVCFFSPLPSRLLLFLMSDMHLLREKVL